MRTISYRVDDLKKAVISIGFVAENEHTQVRIDASDLYAEYPGAAVSMTVQPPDGEAYPAVVTREGNVVVWDVKDSSLTAEGFGEIQLSFTENGVVAKTYIGRIRIDRSLVGTGEVPTPIEDFLTEAGAALTAIPETINAALEAAKESGEFDGPQGPAGADGQPGYSPSASVSKSGHVATIVITDKDGTTTAQISDGDAADVSMKADKVSGATSGHLAGLDENGNLMDSGVAGSTVANQTYVGNQINNRMTSAFGTEFGKIVPAYDEETVYSEGDLCSYPDVAGVYPSNSFRPSVIYKHKSWGAATPEAESWDSTHWEAVTVDEELSSLKSAINGLEIDDSLLFSEMPGTSTTVTMDNDGNPTSIVHTANSATVRTDLFVWSTGSVTETRTLANGKYITITTDLITLAQTISQVQEVA